MTTTDQGITCKHGLPHGHPCSQCGAEAISSRTFPQHKDLLDAGYAPGGYAFKCMDCGCEAVGDKRARRCQSCAEKRLLSGVSSIPSKDESPVVFNLRQIAASDIARWDIRNHIAAAADEIERLTRERDEWAAKWHRLCAELAELKYPGMKGVVRPLSGEHPPSETSARRLIDCKHERAKVQCPDCGIDFLGGIRTAPRDVPIWICSVCGGWNHMQDKFCTHTHAVEQPEKACAEPSDAEKRAMCVDLDSRDHEAR